ncbi:uracil-DNA glycosylase [Scheffersomyces xylosifermentans]|uniref:uracil-DNA glycosylase n=1 Tax=Scheffersomyces xylosifermentans TaxID=1304137 RepID=UPI00315CC0F1
MTVSPVTTNAQPKRKLITDFFKTNSDSVKKQKKMIVKKSEKVVVSEVNTRETLKEAPKEAENQVEKTPEEPKIAIPTAESNLKASDDDFTEICAHYNFIKDEWLASLTAEQKQLLDLEISTLHISWLAALHKELTKPYFLNLKRFLATQRGVKVFPPEDQIYSWSHYTPLPNIKCLVIGQDPYHNHNQAHGLAFSVLEPTPPPPSLINIYKTLAIDFKDFKIPDHKALAKSGTPGGGNLTKWARGGVLLLNSVLTVECHKANSHAKRGWETFTEEVISAAIKYHSAKDQGFVIMAWGNPAQKRVEKFNSILSVNSNFNVLRTVHPSPLSASRGFFTSEVFKKCNQWLISQDQEPIDWNIV